MSAGNSQQQIAELLGRHKSTISREIARNTGVEVIDLDKPVCWLRNAPWGLVMQGELALNSGLRQ
nr:helix-turn-helix domain-containing protein [Polynucleobacter rarus]